MGSLFREEMEILGDIPESKIKLIVLILSFNQDKYLENAVESVLSQDYQGAYKVVIHDDSSIDYSGEIIRKLVRKHPNRVIGIMQNRNKFSVGVNILEEVHRLIPSEYVARLDADDFWLSRDKLSKQVLFLDENKDVSLSAHSIMILNEVKNETSIDAMRKNGFQSPGKFSLCNFVSTASVMYRVDLAKPLPNSFTKQYIQDWPLWSILANRGRVYFHRDLLSVYRIHGNNGFARKANSFFVADTLAINLMIANFLDASVLSPWRVTYALRRISSILDRFFAHKVSTVLNLLFNSLAGIKRETIRIEINHVKNLISIKKKNSNADFLVDKRAKNWISGDE